MAVALLLNILEKLPPHAIVFLLQCLYGNTAFVRRFCDNGDEKLMHVTRF